MYDLFQGTRGDWLPLDEYWSDFERQFWQTGSPGFWKLERQQTFQEPNEESWQAFVRGHWDTALAAIGSKRSGFDAYYAKIRSQGFVNRRVRIVEWPITPYLQWELHVLLLRHECGGLTSVVPAEQVAPLEKNSPLPEVYTLGNQVMYEAVYDEQGVLAGAHRITNTELIVVTQRLIADLYDRGEPLDEFFTREIAPLPPPPVSPH